MTQAWRDVTVRLLGERSRAAVVSMASEEVFSKRPETVLKRLFDQPPVLFNPHRIAIMLEIYHAGGVDFPQVKHDLSVSDGALATHLNALADSGLISVRRNELVDKRERTTYIITAAGVKAIEMFLSALCDIRNELKIGDR